MKVGTRAGIEAGTGVDIIASTKADIKQDKKREKDSNQEDKERFNKSTKFCKPLLFLSYIFVFHHLFLRIRNYLTKIFYHSWLDNQHQISDIYKA